ncbi:MAG: ATP-binding cassette domain-containing protein, partial [Bacilli bacterium]
EQQRVAIAIALVNEPQILLADEPTGSVDTATAEMILNIFRKFNEELGLTVVIVTHDPSLAKKVDRVVAIRDGMTATEFLRRKEAGEFDEEETHEEYVVIDKAGRLQVPRDYLEQLKIDNRVKMEFDGEKIIIRTP